MYIYTHTPSAADSHTPSAADSLRPRDGTQCSEPRDTNSINSCCCLRCSTLPVQCADPSFGGVREGRTTDPTSPPPPPPPVTTKLKTYPSNILQNPPYCTNLQLKIKKSRGLGPHLTPPLTCISHSLNVKYPLSSILQGFQLTYFENTPAIQNTTPLQKFLGTGLMWSNIYTYETKPPKHSIASCVH